MLAGRSFAIIVVCNHYPLLALLKVLSSNLRNASGRAREDLGGLVYFVRVRIYRADESVVRDVFQMTSEAEPRPCGRNMMGCAFAFHFKQNR